MPEIRAVRETELPAVYDLLDACFPEARRDLFVAQTERDPTFRLDDARVAIVDGEVAGYVRIFRRTMLVRGVKVSVGGIGSVATRADTRGNGLATALLHDALGQMRSSGVAVSFLFTGIPAFYERLGYRLVRQPIFQANAAEAASFPRDDRFSVRVAESSEPWRDLYARETGGSTGAIVRDEASWRTAQSWLDEGRDGCFEALRNGALAGYLRSRCRSDGRHQILEAFGEHNAVTALVRAVGERAAAHGETLVATLPADSRVALPLRSLPSTTETTELPYPMMVRIVSLRPLLEELVQAMPRARGGDDRQVSLGFTSEDGEAIALSLSADRAKIVDPPAEFSIDAASTVDVIFGQRAPSALANPAPPPDAARVIDAWFPETPLQFWHADRI